MYAHILIAVDGTDLSNRGLEQGLALAKALGSKVTVLTVSEPWMPLGVDATGAALTEYALVQSYDEAEAKAADGILKRATESAKAAGVSVETVFMARLHPSDAIIETAEAKGVDLIVMASHGRRGLDRLVLGSQTIETLTLSKVPVLVVR